MNKEEFLKHYNDKIINTACNGLADCTNCLKSSWLTDCNYCSECANCTSCNYCLNCFDCVKSNNCKWCINVHYSVDCINLQNAIGCTGMHLSKDADKYKYYILNSEVSEEEFVELQKELLEIPES